MAAIELDKGSRAAIMAGGKVRRYAAGQYVCREGDEGDSLFFVLSGVLEAQKRLSSSYCIPLRQFGPGTLLGEVSFLGISDRTADVVAMDRSEVVEMNREKFEALKASDPETALKVLSAVAASLATGLKNTDDNLKNALLCAIEGLDTTR